MRRALELAEAGIGAVEPNPPVGAVVVDREFRLLGEGRHKRYGGPHAEVNALNAAGELARGAMLFVTLEPCNHQGQTPPCTAAIERAGVACVVVATKDPARHGGQSGLERLRALGIDVKIGVLEEEARRLIAPFTKLVTAGRPFVHAKWAMSLDGRIATRFGESQWITSEESRAVAHRLRGRMDAIVVGIGTAIADNPRLTARPPGPRTATRIVLDSRARLPLDLQLVQTARETPVLVCCSREAPLARRRALESAGVELLECECGDDGRPLWGVLLEELGRRRMTNVLVEGGSEVLGSCFDAGAVDQVHVFIGAKILGGRDSLSAVAGSGCARLFDAYTLDSLNFLKLGKDAYFQGNVACHERG
ncbi:MAG: bifunctional diaminohydroxyphosphoribosylaminopyrimidine deaminase/5-amino-6-(5-phosphoribosylamino)uracil reductase RibD [Planctomycetaceae bacterium]